MDKSHVYLICTGERSQGHSPEYAFDSFNKARNEIELLSPGQQVKMVRQGVWFAPMPNGIDEVWLYKIEVM